MANKGILSGMKVLDFTIALSGPYVTWQFADLGAEVWKVERQKTGDQARYWDPCVADYEGQSTLFIDYNKNKKSIEINLGTPEGKQIIYDMVKECDVVVENFKSGSIDRLGLGYDVLKEINPKVVMLSLSGFGGSGPLMKLPCYDAIAAARGGFAASNGEPDGAPMKAGNANCDTLTASYSINAILMGVIHARKTGKGCHIDIGMADTVMETIAEPIVDYGLTGSTDVRFGNHDRFIAPYGIFEARDGWVSIIADTDEKFAALSDVLGLKIKDDPKYKDNASRIANKDALVAEIEAVTKLRKRSCLEEKLLAAGVPAAQVLPWIEAFTSDQTNTVGATKNVWQDKVGMMKFYTNPILINDEQGEIHDGAPLLGKHTSEILGELGYDQAKIDKLFEDGIVYSTLI